MTNSINDVPKFSPGQMLNGKLKSENVDKKRINNAIIQLYGVEYPKWGIWGRTISEKI